MVWVRPTLNAGMSSLPPRPAVRRTTSPSRSAVSSTGSWVWPPQVDSLITRAPGGTRAGSRRMGSPGVPGAEGEVAVAAAPLGRVALEQPAVEQHGAAAGVHPANRAGDRPGG